MRKSIAVFAAALLLALAMTVPVWAAAVGDPAPEITIDMLSGGKVVLKELAEKQKVIVIAFIQTACTTCKAEIVELQDAANKYKGKVYVLPVSVDMRNAKAFLESYKKDYGIDFDFGMDPEFKIPKMFGMSSTPGSLVIKDGKVAAIHLGYDEAVRKDLVSFFK